MPLVRTSAGMRPSAWLTRFCTSTAARSGSRPTSNVTVIVAEAAVGARRGHVDHALDAVDGLLERRGDRALDRLRVGAGVERGDASPTAAPAPGYRAIGSVGMAIAPARMMSSEQTVARIGRRMKTFAEHVPTPPTSLARRRAGARLRHRRDRRAVADLLDARRRSAARPALRPLTHDVVVADQRAELDRALLRHGRPAVARSRRRTRSTGR